MLGQTGKKRREQPASLHRAVRAREAGDLQGRQRLRKNVYAAATQPYVGSLCDQHGRCAADGSNPGVCEGGEIAVFRPAALPESGIGTICRSSARSKAAIFDHMKVEDIAEAVAKLPPDELARFRRWFSAFEAGRTDHAAELDSTATKLGRFAGRALAELKRRAKDRES